MKETIPYIHRDISWLDFNYRVLQEAMDKNVPLLERIKFLSIYSSNLEEFFKVRVANHKNLIRAGKKTFKKLEFAPKQILKQILSIVNKQQEVFSSIFENQIVPELKTNGINIVRWNDLNEEQIQFVDDYFIDELQPHVQPILLKDKMIKPFLQNSVLYLAIYMKNKDVSDYDNYYGLIRAPSHIMGRFIELPKSKKNTHDIIILDDIIRSNVTKLFPGFNIIDSFSIKQTRDAELYIDDEYSGDLIAKIKKGISKRDIGTAARLVYDREMPSHFLDYLTNVFEFKEMDILPEGRYHNNSDLFRFPSFGKTHLKDIKLSPIPYKALEGKSIFGEINKKDHILYYPYHSYQSVVNFFEKAAVDKNTTHIKVLQYRVAKESKIMDALIKAAKNGISVTAFVEIKARFDESNNLSWGEKLEAAGVNVIYSLPGIKVHSKMAIVIKNEGEESKNYAYLSTGNFNETTADLYTDFGLFTSDYKLIKESKRIFKYLETKVRPSSDFKYLGVGTFNLKEKLIELVNAEITSANNGKEAYLILKMNSLQDTEMIDLLYAANKAGVEIKLIVRGICCIIPGIRKSAKSMEAISIVDRYLEHARVFIFGNNGDEKIYLSSADWMERNLHYRIETMFPILDPACKKTIRDIINIQLDDNVKARNLDFRKSNTYKKKEKPVKRSQLETYYYIKGKTKS